MWVRLAISRVEGWCDSLLRCAITYFCRHARSCAPHALTKTGRLGWCLLSAPYRVNTFGALLSFSTIIASGALLGVVTRTDLRAAEFPQDLRWSVAVSFC